MSASERSLLHNGLGVEINVHLTEIGHAAAAIEMDQCNSRWCIGIGVVGFACVFGVEKRQHLGLWWFKQGYHSEGEWFVWDGILDDADCLSSYQVGFNGCNMRSESIYNYLADFRRRERVEWVNVRHGRIYTVQRYITD